MLALLIHATSCLPGNSGIGLTYADAKDNTADPLDFQPRPKAVAGLLILDLAVQPVPARMAVFKCNWDLLPPAAAGAR